MGRNSTKGHGGAALTGTPLTGAHAGAPERPADAGWLALRTPADNAARELSAGPLVEPLVAHLRTNAAAVPAGKLAGAARLHVVDLGAGAGANARWLAPRLPFVQHWTLIDHDASLLAQADAPVNFTAVTGRMDQLEELLGSQAAERTPAAELITCSALLDVLTAEDIEAIGRTVALRGAAALFSLSVTGRVLLTPEDPFDAAVAQEFDAHQRRGGRLGPQAPTVAASVLERHGLQVRTCETPWILSAGDPELLSAWLHGRAEAALEQSPNLAAPVHRWLESRLEQAARSELSARVDHLDLLATAGPTAG